MIISALLGRPDCRYIAGEEIPVNYGGLKRENDPDFSTDDGVSDVTVKAGSTETIEIPTPKVNERASHGFSPSLVSVFSHCTAAVT